MIKLALIYGGKSAEREVSIAGAKGIEQALDKKKYIIKKYDAAKDLPNLVKDASELDCAFILLHGKFGEDGTIQGLLDLIGLPYQSSGVLGSAIAMDKHISKILYKENGLLTPKWLRFYKDDQINETKILENLNLPVVVKPCNQGSSVGITIVRDITQLNKAITDAFNWDNEVIVEQYIKGREITGGVLGLEELVPLPIVEIIPGEEFAFFDYKAKYEPGATKEICPADIPLKLTELAQKTALAAHKALRLSIYSRTDMILTEDEKIYAIETNTIPGMTPTSLFPQAAKAYGLSFTELLDKLIDLALKRAKG